MEEHRCWTQPSLWTVLKVLFEELLAGRLLVWRRHQDDKPEKPCDSIVRTPMTPSGNREITCIQLDITTHCNLRCPDCSVGIGINRKLQHHPWEYFEKVAPFIYGIERVDVFGGEPTVHPRFKEFVPRFRELFGCKTLSLTTNCAKVQEHSDVLNHFDFIQATSYEKNGPALTWIQQIGKDVRLFPPGSMHISRTRVGGGRPCSRAICETVSYADGKFYPCPCGPGIEAATGFEPTRDWKQKIQSWPMPCESCFLSQ